MADIVRFRRAANGAQEEVPARVDDVEFPAGEFLMARTMWLEGELPEGRELVQHRPVGGDRRQDGYLRLDNEILAGRRLADLAGGGEYPQEVIRLYGDESISAEPFALWEPSPGEPLREVGELLVGDEFESFVIGLLAGLCWLAGAGIAHRAISPDTVLWDSDSGRVRITDFSRSAPFGSVRTPLAGSRAWIAHESLPDSVFGLVGPSDDIWAAARLIYFVRSRGKDLDNPASLREHGLTQMFNGMLEKVLVAPDSRPTARDLIEFGLRRPHLLPGVGDGGKRLIKDRTAFLNVRASRHPDAALPPDFWADINWAGGQRRAGGQPGGPG